MKFIRWMVLVSLLSGFVVESYAQINRDRFGKNRIQFKNFDWRYYSSDNFDIYFYEGGQNNALIAAKFLEKEFERITDVIGYAPYTKTKIFLYNSVGDLQQSNVGVRGKTFTVGGQTNFVKSQVEVAYPGSMIAFKNELVQQIAEMLINDMMFGGSLTDMFQSAYLLTLPEWFIQGAARYIAQGWSIEMDDFIREMFHDNRNIKLTRYTGEDAAIIGQSVWNFIAVRYGRSSISNILNLTRIIRNEESSIVNTLGIPFKLFGRQWQSFYGEMAAQTSDVYQFPESDDRLRKKNRKSLRYNQVAFSPSGRYLAYSENKNGRYNVIVRDLERRKSKKVHSVGFQLIDQDVDQNLPLLNWANDQTLGIVGYEKGRNYLWIHNRESKRTRTIQLRRFNQVKYFDLNESGRLAVMSADLNGKNDLFLYNPNRNTFKRITTDIYDDLYPRFMPESDNIIFSSNRPNDSLYFAPTKTRDIQLNQDIDDNFNIFIYNPDQSPTDSLLNRVTNTISKDIKPIPKDENTIYYLSDQQGIYNLYQYELRDSLFTQVSNYAVSIQDFDIDFKNNRLAFVMLADERDYVFLEDGINLDQSIFTPKTQRQQAIQARLVSDRLLESQRKRNVPAQSNPATVDQPFVPRDSLTIDTDTDTRLDSLSFQDSTPVVETDTLPDNFINTDSYEFGKERLTLEEGMIDTENYTFDVEPESDETAVSTDDFEFESEQQDRRAGNSFLSRYRRLRRETRIDGPTAYETRFSADNVVTSLMVDPLRNFGFHIQVQMNDMLENHRFSGGIVQFTDLRSASVFAEYQYLKNRVDFQFRYERDGIYREANDRNIQKYTKYRFMVGAAVPFNVSTRLEINPFIANTHYIDLSTTPSPTPPTAETENTTFFGGIRSGLVFDNTLNYGLNKYEGTRARAFFTHYQGLNDATRSFSNIEVDIRHYLKIHRELTLVGRVYYGNFFGANPQSYLLGGMHNWIFNRTDSNGEENDPLAMTPNVDNSNILFTEFVDLRGFNYNKFNGTDVLTFTAELRFPVIRYFYQGPIASNFFRNLEFIGFYDIGSAWTGPSPFQEENSINTEVIEDGGPFIAEIKNFKDPWLMSYGAGIRTVLLGYYLKFDVAYPIEDRIVADDPRFYFTLGYDF